MITNVNEAGGSSSSPALEFGLLHMDHEKGLFFHPSLDSAPHGLRGGHPHPPAPSPSRMDVVGGCVANHIHFFGF
jgi:hypothetical protein